jgi:hypothetical protein
LPDAFAACLQQGLRAAISSATQPPAKPTGEDSPVEKTRVGLDSSHIEGRSKFLVEQHHPATQTLIRHTARCFVFQKLQSQTVVIQNFAREYVEGSRGSHPENRMSPYTK